MSDFDLKGHPFKINFNTEILLETVESPFLCKKTEFLTDITFIVGASIARPLLESIEIKKIFLAEKNPAMKLGLIIE